MTAESKIIKELQNREKLMFDGPTYDRLRSVTGFKHDSNIAHVLTRLENKGFIERRGKGSCNIHLTEKGRAA